MEFYEYKQMYGTLDAGCTNGNIRGVCRGTKVGTSCKKVNTIKYDENKSGKGNDTWNTKIDTKR